MYLSHFEAHSTFPGATPLKFSLVGSLSVAIALLCAPLANILTKHFGHRTPMLAGKQYRIAKLSNSILLTSHKGMLACSLGQCMAGLCTTFRTYIVCQGFLFGIGKKRLIVSCHALLSSANCIRTWVGQLRCGSTNACIIGVTDIWLTLAADVGPITAALSTLVRSYTEPCTSKRVQPF